jgi:hypothetical protein
MVSPFEGYDNAELFVVTPGSESARDSSGNWVTVGDITTTYKAFLKGDRASSKPVIGNEYQPETDSQQFFVKGYLVDPMIFPATIQFPIKLACHLKTANGIQQGEIVLDLTPEVFNVAEMTGQKISGWFRSTRNNP